MKWVAALLLPVLILTANPLTVMPTPPSIVTSKVVGVSQTPKSVEPKPVLIRALICAYALKYGVEPAAAMAVARVESGKGRQEFRVGKMGRGTYYGPFGIHKCFLKRWPINTLEGNIEVGVRALSHHRSLRDVLKKYNTAFNEAYWQAVVKARNEYRKKGVG